MKDHHSIKLLPSANTVNPIDIKREVMVRALKCHVLDLKKNPSAEDFILLPRLRNMKSWRSNWTMSKAFCNRNLIHLLFFSVLFHHSLLVVSDFQVYIGKNCYELESMSHSISSQKILKSLFRVHNYYLQFFFF